MASKSVKNISKNSTNTKFDNIDEINSEKSYRIKYPYTTLPENFNGREMWPDIDGNIYDQGECGSCWAFATCSLLSDRYLVTTNGRVNVTLSPTRLLLCNIDGIDLLWSMKTNEKTISQISSKISSSRETRSGACYGNTISNALKYLYIYGTCTAECLPYEFNYSDQIYKTITPEYAKLPHNTKSNISIGKSKNLNRSQPVSTLDYIKTSTTGIAPLSDWNEYNLANFSNNNFIPTCGSITSGTSDMCYNYNRAYLSNLEFQGTPSRFYRIGIWYVIQHETLEKTNIAIQQDIYKWGPVVAVMELYRNFYNFDPNKNIYSWDKKSKKLGAHAVEIVGWGIENNVKFWWVKNSWGKEWGIDGYFKIKRGSDECKIESNVMGALPDYFTSIVAPGISVDFHNIYNIDILNRDPNYKGEGYKFKKLSVIDMLKNPGYENILRNSNDFTLFTPKQYLNITKNLDLLHNFIGGIDPDTGFSRRTLTQYTGLNYEAPIKYNDIDLSEKFYAGKKKINSVNKKNYIFFGNYIFYITISICVLMILGFVIKKYIN